MVLRGHESTVLCLAVDHIKIISGSADTQICIWDANNGEI
jgi:WD40 repeat protein